MSKAGPSTEEKEKTARLVESLSNSEQMELLAQALLREYMHRRGFQASLRAFDTECPRDERTIASRGIMRQLLNIPVAGRPSRLLPTVPPTDAAGSSKEGAGSRKASVKPFAPTFMEELCSYRLTKRGYTHPVIKLEDEAPEGAEDPSDTELHDLKAAVVAHRTAKAEADRKQREFEQLLTAEAEYERRKEEHRLKKQQRRKSKSSKEKEKEKKRKRKSAAGSGSQARPHSRQGSDSEAESNSDEDSSEEEDEDRTARRSKSLHKHHASTAEAHRHSHRGKEERQSRKKSKRESARGSAVEAVSSGPFGTAWQPPGLTSTAASAMEGEEEVVEWRGSGDGAGLHTRTRRDSQGLGSHSQMWAPPAETDDHEQQHHRRHRSQSSSSSSSSSRSEEAPTDVDPFGTAPTTQQAMVARVREGARRWSDPGVSPLESPSKSRERTGSTSNDGGSGLLNPVLKGRSAVTATGSGPLTSDLSSLRPVVGGAGVLSSASSFSLGGGGGGRQSSVAAAGYNPALLPTTTTGGSNAYHTRSVPENSASSTTGGTDGPSGGLAGASLSAESSLTNPYSNGFPPPPGGLLGPSILVKHVDTSRRDMTTSTTAATNNTNISTSGSALSAQASSDSRSSVEIRSSVHEYDRSAIPRGSALASGNSGPSSVLWDVKGHTEGRSPSPNNSGGTASLSSPFHTPSRSVTSTGSGAAGGSALRHGIGFRTSMSGDGTTSASATLGEGDAGKQGRKARRVKLLIDD